MKYKGYTILATQNVNIFFELDEDEDIGDEVKVNYQSLNGWDDLWYAVVDKDNWCVQTFETVEECKQFIDEEVEVPEMELKVPYIKPKNAKSEKEVG